MNTGNWANRREIRLLDLTALVDFKTDSCISFHLGTYGIPAEFTDSNQTFIGKSTDAYFVIGWLDIQHPGVGHIKARIRVSLPQRYHDVNVMYEFVRQLFECLEIPADETFEAYFFSPASQTSISRAKDRNGMTDRI